MPSAIGSTWQIDDRRVAVAGALGGGAQRGGVLDGAVEVRLGEDRRARVVVDRRRPRVGVGDAVAQSGTSTTSMP